MSIAGRRTRCARFERWEEEGSVSAKPTGGSISPLEEHTEFLIGLVTEQPDLTLNEIVASMRKAKIGGSRTAVWRFYERRLIQCNICLKVIRPRKETVDRDRRAQMQAADTTRPVVRRDGAVVRIHGRNAINWTDRCSTIAATAATLEAHSFTIDGEAVVMGPDGIAQFVRP